MCKITLIRHGQASFGAENYDLLSDIGREQAVALGDYFKSHQITFDAIIHGEMSRQTETAQIMASAMDHPDDLILNAGANEFDSDHLLKHYLPILAEQSKVFYERIHSKEKWFANGETFEMIFRALIQLWQQDKNCPFESWCAFQKRVLETFNGIYHRYTNNEKIALVTSGGLISVAVQVILGARLEAFMDMNLTTNNASITELLMSESFTLLKSEHIDSEVGINARLLGFNNISPLVFKNRKQLITRK